LPRSSIVELLAATISLMRPGQRGCVLAAERGNGLARLDSIGVGTASLDVQPLRW
jgi:hypothetical protein